MAHHFKIKQNKAGEYVAYFMYNAEPIFWTEGYKSKASAKNAIASVQKNGPGAETVDES
jgi:uncharacterized protein YegP (UPF0339 family)